MEQITIGSYNLRNHYWQHNWDGQTFPHELAQFIKEKDITFLGTQEMVKRYAKKLQEELGINYTINGNYRYGKIPFIDQFNESNAIITNQQVIETRTKHLATIPFIDHLTQMPRIMTSVTTPEHTMINTHIEYWNEYAQIHQLKVLYKYIKHCIETNPNMLPIITGDFNMDLTKAHFLEFIKELEKIGITHISNNTPTYVPKEQILDHIFIPSSYEILDVQAITNHPITHISDHRPLLIKARKK